MQENLTVNGSSAEPAPSTEPTQLGQRNPQERTGASGEHESEGRKNNEQVQSRTTLANATERNSLAVTLWSVNAQHKKQPGGQNEPNGRKWDTDRSCGAMHKGSGNDGKSHGGSDDNQ